VLASRSAEASADGVGLARVERNVQVMRVVEVEIDALVVLPHAHDAVVVDVFAREADERFVAITPR
jgi:hypothetical protein